MKKYLMIALAITICISSFAFAMKNHETSTISEKIDISLISHGNFISTPIDSDQDGVSASLTTLKGKSNKLGIVSANILTEAKPKLDKTGIPEACVTPDGFSGILLELVKARGNYHLKDGDQIFTEAISLFTCINANVCFDENGNVKAGCKFQTAAKGRIIGGTGRFACATGDIQDDSAGLALVVDPKGEFFGSILESKLKGTILIPTDCDK